MSDPQPTGSNLLFDDARRDGLVECPVQGFDEPGVAGHADFRGSGVDAFEHVGVDAEEDFLGDCGFGHNPCYQSCYLLALLISFWV